MVQWYRHQENKRRQRTRSPRAQKIGDKPVETLWYNATSKKKRKDMESSSPSSRSAHKSGDRRVRQNIKTSTVCWVQLNVGLHDPLGITTYIKGWLSSCFFFWKSTHVQILRYSKGASRQCLLYHNNKGSVEGRQNKTLAEKFFGTKKATLCGHVDLAHPDGQGAKSKVTSDSGI